MSRDATVRAAVLADAESQLATALRRSGSVLVAIVTGFGCGSGGSAFPPLPTPGEGGCSLSYADRVPDDPEELVDLLRVQTWLEEHAVLDGTGSAEDRALFSVSFQRAPERRWVRPIAGTLSPAIMEEFATQLFNAFSFPEPGEDADDAEQSEGPPGTFRISLSGGPAPVFALSPSVACAPQIRNREHIQQRMNDLAALNPASGRMMVKLLVAGDGVPSEVEVVEGVRDRVLAEQLPRIALQMRFDPAAIDGFPVPWEVWVQIPLVYNRRRD